jgi:hypothetical protein
MFNFRKGDEMKRARVTAGMVFLALVLAALVGTSGTTPMLAGAGKAEMVVPLGIPLSGYGSRVTKGNTGVHDPVFARALVLSSNGQRAGVISADLLMVEKDMRDDLVRRVPDLKLDLLTISCTHTHYSIGAYVDDTMAKVAVMGKYDPQAREIVLASMEKALRSAAGNLKPARIGSGQGAAPGVAANRRHEGGPTDPAVRVLGVFREDGSLLAVLFNHAVHPTIMPPDTTLVSGDLAGRAESWLEEKHPGAVAMFMNAGEGDQRPMDEYTEKGGGTWAAVDKLGSALAGRTEEVLNKIQATPEVDLKIYDRTFAMPEVYVSNKFNCWYGLGPLVKKLGQGLERKQGEVMGLGLNNALILFSAGEISYEVQAQIQALFPDRLVLVVAQSNDWYGYVVTPQDYDTGGYETCMNLYGRDFAPLYEQQFKLMVEGNPTGAAPASSDCGCGK